MTIKTFSLGGIALISSVAFVGCQDAETRQVEKPVIENDTEFDLEESAEQAADDVSDTVSDAADAVTPDEPIVDIKTPLGDVEVGNDPATGQTNVEVDTPRADVDVSSDE